MSAPPIYGRICAHIHPIHPSCEKSKAVTQSPIEPPNNPDRRPEESAATGPRRPLTFDEMVAMLIAFLSLGTVLFWGLTRSGGDLLSEPLLSNGAVTEPEGDRAPLSLFGDADEDSEPSVATLPRNETADSGRRSARAELAERAEQRRERAGITRPEATGNVWQDFRTGAAGTAAGAAGIAATAGGAEALPETEATEPEAAAPTTEEPAAEVIPQATASEEAKAPPKEAIGFRDVPDGYWAKPYIDGLSSRGLISGFDSGDFMPDEQVTRAQVANIVSRTFALTANKENLEFSDVENSYWARESIGEVVRGGFMTGFPDDTFKPDAPVTRAQALTTLVTGLGIAQPNNVQATLDRYADKGSIPEWATEKVAAATDGSLVVNHPNQDQINASEPTTRADLAAMIYQALVKEGVVEPIESEYLVKPQG